MIPHFDNSQQYWRDRYDRGGDSGRGSLAERASFKAEVLNEFIAKHGVASVIELGCGDGRQLSLARYPTYLGLDISSAAVDRCKDVFKGDDSKRFALMSEEPTATADLALSIDVIYHLVEDDVFGTYMWRLFNAARRFIIIYSTDAPYHTPEPPHIRHRHFTEWVGTNAPAWDMIEHIPTRFPPEKEPPSRGTSIDFYVYRKLSTD